MKVVHLRSVDGDDGRQKFLETLLSEWVQKRLKDKKLLAKVFGAFKEIKRRQIGELLDIEDLPEQTGEKRKALIEVHVRKQFTVASLTAEERENMSNKARLYEE